MCYEIHGRRVERLVFGLCSASFRGYMPWQEAMQQVREHQPHQKRPVPIQLEAELGRRCRTTVRFYTAVGTALDRYYGVDAVVEVGGVLVTLDITINHDKIVGNADVILHVDDFENLKDIVDRIAVVVAEKIRSLQRR